jgi:hypothetical protein
MSISHRPRYGDGKTEFYKIRVTLGGYIKMVEFVPGCFSCHELLSEWLERRYVSFEHAHADVCAYPLAGRA